MYKKVLFGVAMIATAAGALAAGLNVTGKIVPSSCNIALAGGGVASLGNKTVAQVAAFEEAAGDTGTKAYFYPEPALADLSVTCSAPTAVALKFTDNRASSVLLWNSNSGGAVGSFGLGTHNGAKIGLYAIAYSNLKTTSTVGGTLQPFAKTFTRSSAAAAWTSFTSNWLPADGSDISFADNAAATAPTVITQISGALAIWPIASSAVVDAATAPIQFDGSATIALVYL